MDWITQLDLVQLANAIVIVVVGIAGGLGLRAGLRSPKDRQTNTGSVEVAGALVDSSSVKQLAIEVGNQASAIVDQTAVMRRQTEELEEVRHATNRVREAIDRLAMELARR